MRKQFHTSISAALLLTTSALLLAGCSGSGSSASAQTTAAAQETTQAAATRAAASTQAASEASGGTEVRKIKYAFTNTLKPISYLDEKGEPAGYDPDVIRAIDELLPQYEFEFIGTNSEDAWMGTESGKYQICTTNSFKTAEREQKYLFADTNSGGALYGLILRKENADIKNLKDLAESGLKLTPLRPADASYGKIQEWNDANPDYQIELEAIDQLENADAIRYVAEGRYDAFPYVKTMFDSLVVAEDGELHNLNDQLVINPFTAHKTYGLINRDETEFKEAYQEALHQLRENGTLSELSKKHYDGIDVFEYFDD